ncbi:hypothetical protein GCM10010441_29650 [Kitasatospora paracochleata]|uniref:Nuclease SbcCD subunit C n=1 Tax=Kitasatospora paracochleata TaxID=58354 RepID=A0ABT1J900_9ACTN|nr:hypothetical protein [Kitasatospora paracochleata]MCP2313926.1 chromosome segregation ATPase [Kitasatospora paracochleata]
MRYETNLSPGLNVIAAPNSFGKSTLLQGIIYALGLEGMFSSSRKPPFGPALLTLADWPDGTRSPVRESWVSLTIANEQGAYMRCKRFVRGDGIDTSLIMTWQGSSQIELDRANRVDMFVRQPGAAFRELGFHRALAEFLGWGLPTVPGFNSTEVSLYLEALFPLFYVEQKSGWSGVAPRMPTYLGIRDVLKRSVEYVLGLSALERLTALGAVRSEEDDVKKRWQAASDRLSDAAKSLNCRVFLHQESPVTPARRQHCVVEVMDENSWVPLERQIDVWRQRLSELEHAGVEPAGEHTSQAQEELAVAEKSIREVGGRIRLIDEQLNFSRTDSDALASRLASLDTERNRLADLRKLRSLGSTLGIMSVSNDVCPTCGQLLDGRETATGIAADLDQTIAETEAERETVRAATQSAERRRAGLERNRNSLQAALHGAMRQARALRDELAGPSAAPSRAQVQQQILLASSIERAQRLLDLAEDADDYFDELALRWQDIRDRLADLRDGTLSRTDQQIVSRMNSSFQAQVRDYGLRSVPPSDLSIDESALIPVNDGVELAFDLSMGISASDMIRTKWAYYLSLFEASLSSPRNRHAKLLMLDEPRQQETDRRSLAAFVRRLERAAASGCQVIYATSEDRRDLNEVLSDIRVAMLPAQGPHLLDPVGG